MAVHLLATLTAKPGKFDELASHFRTLATQVHAHEPDTLIYYALENKASNELIVIEKYKNAQVQANHGKTAYFQAFFATVGPLLAGKPVLKKCASVVGGGFEGRGETAAKL
ncbi:hypothetical protein AJ80_09774 [Polytolypa hystricis UAMH7299]|uniref:ABM domain-containing protein n=1 Tax=Polytolypa hystricis (strain UAMH7299) TaxID=1447883 RepID=A0A2B7WJY1_POLH7|nr:hypothetical protein AJ80_09774 [Polytolypa hystricis UAMH7299]